MLSEQETRLLSVCLIPQLIESSSMRTNTDSFNHWHTWSSFIIIVLSSRSPPSGILLFQCVGSAGSKKCQISIRIDSLLLSVTFERCFTCLELFLRGRERWCATGGDSFSLPFYCSHTHTHAHTPQSHWRLFGDLLLEVKQELVVWQGRLRPVLDHVLHKAGLPLALVPETVKASRGLL